MRGVLGLEMMSLFQTVDDLVNDHTVLARRSFGVIKAADEQLESIQLRPWPKTSSVWGSFVGGRLFHGRVKGNRIWLYYNQPWSCPGFLALRYIVSTRETTMRTFRGALIVLDEIARLKRCNAIVCHVTNRRISDRLFARWGWEPHLLKQPGRHFIKRFYGEYPDPAEAWSLCPKARDGVALIEAATT